MFKLLLWVALATVNPIFRPCSRGNTIVPFHLLSFQFLERKTRMFTQERNDCISVFVSIHTGTQSFCSTVLSLALAIFPARTTSTHALRAKPLSFRYLTSFTPHCLFKWEWNGTIAYLSTFHVSLILSFHFLERNNVISSVPV